ncbi:hypothetical protein EVAR_33661_1 [Eumeta japonica]|uniref:Uncharacterized protein n=1 Tax=Eumeta variegata TaxID=151549 RepID=A0A4C1VM01_EUMVA|nr:hypothetical protein EVAR_33661_1 [Eumeta japonica]
MSAIGRSSCLQRTKLCRSELPANDAMRSFNAPQLLPRVPILRHGDVFVTNITTAEFRAPIAPLNSVPAEETRSQPTSAGRCWPSRLAVSP